VTDNNQRLGSTLDSHLDELDDLEEIESAAIQRVKQWTQSEK